MVAWRISLLVLKNISLYCTREINLVSPCGHVTLNIHKNILSLKSAEKIQIFHLCQKNNIVTR